MIGFEVERIKQTELWAAIADTLPLLVVGEDIAKLKTGCDLDPARDVRWIVVALDPSGDHDHGVAVINGAWDKAKVERCAATLGRKVISKGEVTQYDKQLWITWLAPDTAAIALDEGALPFLEEFVDFKASVLRNNNVTRMLDKVDRTAVIWAAGSLMQERSPFDELRLARGERTVASYVSVLLAAKLDARAGVEFMAPDEAERVSKEWRAKLAARQAVLPILAGASISLRGSAIELAAVLDQVGLDALAQWIAGEAERARARRAAPAPN